MKSKGPVYVAQSWGPVPQGLIGMTTSAARARQSLRRFSQAQRESGYYAASRYRVLRCVDRDAAERALVVPIGTTPAGCEHVACGDL